MTMTNIQGWKCVYQSKASFWQCTVLEIRSIACFFAFTWFLGHWKFVCCKQLLLFLFTNLDVDDFGGLHLFAGPRAILECYEGRTIEPFQIPSYLLDVAYEGFLLKPLNKILKDSSPFFPSDGYSFRHSIVDRIIRENDPCKLADLGLVMDAYVMIS